MEGDDKTISYLLNIPQRIFDRWNRAKQETGMNFKDWLLMAGNHQADRNLRDQTNNMG